MYRKTIMLQQNSNMRSFYPISNASMLTGNLEDYDDTYDLCDPPRRYPEPHEIKVELYLRECEKLRVIPVGAYLRQAKANSQSITIRHYNLGPNGARALSAAVLLDKSLTHVDIEGNSISSPGMASMKEALIDNTHVTYLNISDNKLGSRGAHMLGLLMTTNHTIDTLIASRNGFADQDARVFAEIIKENRVLKELVLSGNGFEENAGCVLGQALASNESLEILDVSWNHIRKRGALEFAQGIKENVGLKKLNVSFNGFGTEGTAFMGQALASNRTLIELDMSKNRITNFDILLFAKQLKNNDTLQVFKIGDNLINALGAIEILKSVLEVETSKLQLIDFGTTCVDQGFLNVYEEFKTQRPNVEVRHGRVQNVYLDLDMAPPIEHPDRSMTDLSMKTPISDFDKAEKGKTYVVEGKEDGDDAEADDTEISEKGTSREIDDDDYDESKLDDEISAVTGRPKTPQTALMDDKGSAGTLTPDI